MEQKKDIGLIPSNKRLEKMRKAQKEQIEDFLKSLKEAHDVIGKAIEQKENTITMKLLEECQEGAIWIGNLIEKTEGEDEKTIPILEEYCEWLYQVYKAIIENKLAEGKDMVYKNLSHILIQIEKSIEDITVRLEVVFLPYKASMWDALESVWKVANSDKNCNVYVIPIPYFDKNPDGSFRKMYYEGDQYPEYVPITNYKNYDIENRKPDVIYIHNPYDECNLVTSVHPYFFSSKLKNFTEKLVYIPYFVLDEVNQNKWNEIEEIKHFILVPAVFHAHKVIVQSENMKQVYMKVLQKETKDYSESIRKYWENKIEGTGSPKMDKIQNTKKEEQKIPKEWLKIIEKADGSWKKIIFYNNSISALLEKNEDMLKKMEMVFQLFKNYQEEVALLWRPHPLIESTLMSIRPQLWEAYKTMQEQYRMEGWGIYDETADIDRAIVISDAYYGDRSSVVQMYQRTGKPIMIQNVEILII